MKINAKRCKKLVALGRLEVAANDCKLLYASPQEVLAKQPRISIVLS